MTSTERKMASTRKGDFAAPTEPRETNSIVFEWPLRGLKQMFENSKTDHKSKVIKSAPFGGGRWTVLFYAQSGIDQFCSLYLNAEPLPHERVHPLLAGDSPASDVARDTQGTSSKSKADGGSSMEEKWTRKGLFRFTFNIQTMDDKTNLGTKEAHDHAFSHKTSNWGWAQFAKRDHVYYKTADVIRDDGFLISVTITSSPEKPKVAKPASLTVPPVLVHAVGSLLDDPEHSDVVFYLYPRRRPSSKLSKPEVKKVYAIRKILSARSEYFRDMFESGFQEAEAEESSSEEESALQASNRNSRLLKSNQTPAHPQRSHHAAARAEQAKKTAESDEDEVDQDEYDREYDDDEEDEYEDQNAIMEDSDEDIEEILLPGAKPDSLHQDANPNEDDDAESEGDEDEDEDEFGGERVTEEATESDEEQDRDTTRDGGYAIAATSSTPPLPKQGGHRPNRRQSSGTYVDANSNQLTEVVSSANEADVNTFANGSHFQGVDPEEIVIEQLAASAPHQKRPSTSSSPTMSNRGHHSKRERVSTNEASTVLTKSAVSTSAKRSSGVHRRKRRKVSIVDSAYPTFKALLFFLYTDTVEFAPLTSSFLPSDVAADGDSVGNNTNVAQAAAILAGRRMKESSGQFSEEMLKARKKRKYVIESHLNAFPERPSPCSAKAMYRLADKLDIPDLKHRAQEHIAKSLTIQNIVWEVFSGFTAHYPDILKMETDFLLKHWPQVKRNNAMKSIFLRHSAHPGLAQVWPHLLECLEYRRPEADDTDEAH